MSEQDNFVARWSRLKRASNRRKKDASGGAEVKEPDRSAADAGRVGGTPSDVRVVDARSEAPFDPATLPPIDSIVAGSDIRAFLQKGVPAELAAAALRCAWTTDPAIRDFIGIAENQWDFTNPAAIPGFGPIGATGDLRQLVAQALGQVADAPDPVNLAKGDSEAASRGEAAAARASPDQEVPALPEQGKSDDRPTAAAAAPQHPQPADANRRVIAHPRGHGGALPR